MSKHVSLALLLLWPSLLAAKRPLNADDYDGWRHIQNQTLSNDGHFLAYAVFPQQGDGEVVVRDLKTGKETRQPAGELPPPPAPDFSSAQRQDPPPVPPGVALRFTSDSRFLIFSTFPAHAAVQTAKREKRKLEAMPKGDIVILNLSSGAMVREPRVRDFQLPTYAGDYIAYMQLPATPAITAAEQSPPASGAAHPHDPKHKKLEMGDLVLYNLITGKERRFPQVSEYLLAKDGSVLLYDVSVPGNSQDGVFAVTPGSDASPTALLAGAGRYRELNWDEDQTRVAFLSDHDHPGIAEPDWKLYTWDRHSPAAVELMSNHTPGIPEDWCIAGRAKLTVAKGGERIFVSTAPETEPPPPPSTLPEDERVSVDLWSWKDDYIQPVQKIRARTERERAYRGVYDLATKKFVQLADPSMNDLLPSEDGSAAIGNDDRAYRRQEEYDNHFFDTYIVDTTSGARTLIARKHINRLSWSPVSRYAIYFNGKDWISIDTSDARAINLTSKLGVAFANEQNDVPNIPDSYRMAGWTRGGRFVLLYDRYDIWRCAPDGSSTVNLTQGVGRRNRIQLRLVRFSDDAPASKWIDLDKPLLLRAENDQTHDTGFYELAPPGAASQGPPRKLIYAAKNFAPPIKARDADVYVTAASTFSEYPDLLLTDRTFHTLKKATDVAPQLANLLWGTAELMHYNNLDGTPLQGVLYKPENFDPKKKYPLLVYIYERLTQNVNNFIEPRPYNSISPSMFVSNGYLVLEPDIVYRVGYPGQSALNCVLPAIQAVVNQGFVDENAIGIQGHSWGGYQIAYMITRTNRFRAAAAGAPVADMISAYDGIRWGPGVPRQFQYERTQSRIGGSVWEYPLRYIENSPIFMADRVNTPVLMIHNDADDAVPWYQGIEYYLALRRLNKEVYMFTYNGEPHNLRRRADQKDYSIRLQQYFDHFLKGAPEPDWMTHGIPYLEKPGVAATLSTDDEP